MQPYPFVETLFRHNLWANLRLLEVCTALSDEQLHASAVGGFGSINDTWQHIVRAGSWSKASIRSLPTSSLSSLVATRRTIRGTTQLGDTAVSFELRALSLTERMERILYG